MEKTLVPAAGGRDFVRAEAHARSEVHLRGDYRPRLSLSERYNCDMADRPSALVTWSPEQVAQGREWVAAWKRAGPALEEVRRRELRALNAFEAIALLCGPADYRLPPRAPKPTSGLVEQQRLFRRFQPR